jgi:integration host factor subunit alpha
LIGGYETIMTKAEIVQALYARVGGFSKKESADIVDLVFEMLKATLGKGEKIKISGFGNFVLRDKRQRPGRNPQTGDPIKISERRVLTFKASQILKQALNPRHGGVSSHGLPPVGAARSSPPPMVGTLDGSNGSSGASSSSQSGSGSAATLNPAHDGGSGSAGATPQPSSKS